MNIMIAFLIAQYCIIGLGSRVTRVGWRH